MEFIKKHFWNIFFALFIAILFFNPFGIGIEIKSRIIRLISGSPSSIEISERKKIQNYDWELVNSAGEVVDFNFYKNRVVVVSFWATWCPPCIAEMPSLQALYNDYGNKVDFVLVANDTPQKVNPFMKKNNYSLPIFYEKTSTLEEFKTRSIPTTFIINKNGQIVVSKKGAANWNSKKIRGLIDDLLLE